MPELPEVETIRLGLKKNLVGHKIEDLDVRLPKIISGDTTSIIGAKVKAIRRIGKGLIIDLDNGYSIAVHIKLTGQLIYRDEKTKNLPLSKERVGELPNKQTHLIFALDKGAILYYTDLRRFGWVKIVKTEEVKNLPFFKEMGPEPFKDLTLEKFKEIISKVKGPIKPLLMDQKKIGGIGNIYANDGLFDAGIDPRRKANTLSDEEIKKLYNSILKVLKRGLEFGGASELNFVNSLGQDGKYQEHFLVYARKGKKCLRCGGTVEKIYLGGRGTFFCPACQS
ncbi:MAG: bifunctional DNA-formamidopyrimidine glycosylase/DNA-(apurinic or apyrimidinic site) lyase [Patescibacteria group bacterium]|nr:bifunctional DNA-formamidopyrimidine glycosylase/DNA-(apurinic or apyrimidinic site) lyase [Patescibacteria group bacterium]